MRILFLDQSGNLGGAELCLLDLAKFYGNSGLVAVFADGTFPQALNREGIPVTVLGGKPLQIRKDSNFWQSAGNIGQIIALILQVVKISRDRDLIYANTQKALVIGAIASLITRKPLVYHLHDILSLEHFSPVNRKIAVFMANSFAALVIANSEASKSAFIDAGGNTILVKVVYNGFDLAKYQTAPEQVANLRQELNLKAKYIVGHFSRLSPWKGQHILLKALAQCPETTAILVGDALFGEEEYVRELHQLVKQLELSDRVLFLGFRDDIPQLMSLCDLITHTSTAAEPLGRVIIEGMLAGKPVIATAAGGAVELIDQGNTGWLTTPGDVTELAQTITQCQQQPEITKAVAIAGQKSAQARFDQAKILQQIDLLLKPLVE